jgi:ketosteroid isomerase-like protein
MAIDRDAGWGLPSVTQLPGVMMKPWMSARRRIGSSLVYVPLLVALALAAWAAPLYGGLPKPQKHEHKREIDQLEDAWRNAILKANTAAMDALLADDYMGITASGTLQSKEQMLVNLRSGTLHFTSIEFSDRKVRFYGATALVISRADVSGTNPEGDFSGSYRYTRVYVRNERGEWKIVSFEASRIRDPGEHNEHR